MSFSFLTGCYGARVNPCPFGWNPRSGYRNTQRRPEPGPTNLLRPPAPGHQLLCVTSCAADAKLQTVDQ